MMKRILLVTGLLLFAGQVSVVRGDEIAELKKQLAEMQKRLEQLEAKQKQQEQQMAASQKQQEEQIEAKVDAKVNEAVAEKDVAVPDSLKWAEKVKLSGDFRYRHEYIDQEDGSGDRHRNRIRARLNTQDGRPEFCTRTSTTCSTTQEPAAYRPSAFHREFLCAVSGIESESEEVQAR